MLLSDYLLSHYIVLNLIIMIYNSRESKVQKCPLNLYWEEMPIVRKKKQYYHQRIILYDTATQSF